MSDLEYCEICDEETGGAGRLDDSIFAELKTEFFGKEKGDEVGPLCLICYESFLRLGLIDE